MVFEFGADKPDHKFEDFPKHLMNLTVIPADQVPSTVNMKGMAEHGQGDVFRKDIITDVKGCQNIEVKAG